MGVVRHYARWPSAAENWKIFDVTKLRILNYYRED